MKVNILGTGSTYSKSNCASILINDDTLIDVGPGTTKTLLKMGFDITKIKYILFTHLHGDHILDLLLLMSNLEVMNLNHQIDIYGPRGTEAKIYKLVALIDNRFTDVFVKENLVFHEISDGLQTKIGQHTLEVCEVIHGDIEAYAFLIDGKLGISGDSAMCENIKKLAQKSGVFICDCSKEIGDVQHMGIDNIMELSSLNPQLKIIPTHFRDETKTKLESMHLKDIPIVDDGYTFDI